MELISSDVKHINQVDPIYFERSLKRAIWELEERGFVTEVHYSSAHISGGSMMYSAIVLGRKK